VTIDRYTISSMVMMTAKVTISMTRTLRSPAIC
jgi:hypothetical protein